MIQNHMLSYLKGIVLGVAVLCAATGVQAQSYAYESVKGDPM